MSSIRAPAKHDGFKPSCLFRAREEIRSKIRVMRMSDWRLRRKLSQLAPVHPGCGSQLTWVIVVLFGFVLASSLWARLEPIEVRTEKAIEEIADVIVPGHDNVFVNPRSW